MKFYQLLLLIMVPLISTVLPLPHESLHLFTPAPLNSTTQPTSQAHNPILIITSVTQPFSHYYTEILRAEGLNEFAVCDVSSLSPKLLSSYDIAILGDMLLSPTQAQTLATWIDQGGSLIAMRPDKMLASTLGLKATGSYLSNGYILAETSNEPCRGIVSEPIQFHGTADIYAVTGAAVLARLFSDRKTETSSPAIILTPVGEKGGQAAAFTYDLAKSIVYTRQGNPDWSGQERDGLAPIRPDDLFFGASVFDPQPDWVDPLKVSIPQADEQQRLLANLIIQMTLKKKPLPRFWYLPRGLSAAVVMTGDDHGNGGTSARFDSYLALSPTGCSVERWECIRATSYIFTNTPLSDAAAYLYTNMGFELAPHLNTDCADWTPSSLEFFFDTQLSAWGEKYPNLPTPVTTRTHCVAWSDYATQPAVELRHGIRLDTSYYFWPAQWVANHPGFFTGSGMPMRFASADGEVIDVYQVPTQLTDESGQTYPFTIDILLDRAIGPEGFYGVITVNAHNDKSTSRVSDAVVKSALARGIPIISARQLLTWLDARNQSSFKSISFDGRSLTFSISTVPEANGLVAMVPIPEGKTVKSIVHDDAPVSVSIKTVKGIRYARFAAATGRYEILYGCCSSDTAPWAAAKTTAMKSVPLPGHITW